MSSIENLYCIGRNGEHRYNNMDHSMLTAIEAVKTIINDGDKAKIWNVNTEKIYHEYQNEKKITSLRMRNKVECNFKSIVLIRGE